MKTNSEGLLQGVARLAATTVGSLAGGLKGAIDSSPHAEQEPAHAKTNFESSDVSSRGVFLAGVGVLAGTWISMAVLYLVFSFFSHERARESPPPLAVAGRKEALPPQPRLQQSPPRDLKAFRAHEDWELNHYYWIDKSSGTVAIPITKAIQLVAARGIPPLKLPPNATSTAPQEGSRLTGFEGKVEPEPR